MDNKKSEFEEINFDPIAYLNTKFPDEESLAGLDQEIESLNAELADVNKELIEEIHEHAMMNIEISEEIEKAKQLSKQIINEIGIIKEKAKKSEQIVYDMCKDLKSLDIVMETIKKTNCGNGLYTGQQLNAQYFEDKDRKIGFLQKIIRLIELMNGTTIEAKPAKMVAGLEPELTNLFLQELYKCATSGKASEPYVNKVLGKGDPEPEKKEPEKKEEKKEIKKPERPPSAARLAKKPSEQTQPQPTQQLAKKPVKDQDDEVPPPEEKPVKQQPQKAAAKQEEYSGKVREVMKQAQEQVAAQKETEKEQAKNTKGINLGKLNKKKKDVSEKIISSGGELTDKQLQLVQNMIQSICQNTAPLGKSIEFVNDDVEAMNKELTHWRKQYNSSKAKTQSQMKLTEEALLPIYDKINQIEQQILDQKSKIQTTKAQILKNDSVIRDLLMSVVTTK